MSGRADERGTGLVGTTLGVTFFLAFVLLATQVLLGLYTTSLVTAAAVDAATVVAHNDDPTNPLVQQDATDRARRRLGAFASQPGRMELEWAATTTDDVIVTVHARAMTVLPSSLGHLIGTDVNRTIHVRAEHLR